MAPRDAIRALAVSRIALGVALVLFPRLVARIILGRDATTPAATVISRALGARDALVGGMVLHTVDTPQVARRWILSCAGIDTVDGLAAIAARRGLKPREWIGFAAIALGSAAAHGTLAQGLTSTGGSEDVAARSTPEPASSPETVYPDGTAEAARSMGARTAGQMPPT